jgi:hypothetical protein
MPATESAQFDSRVQQRFGDTANVTCVFVQPVPDAPEKAAGRVGGAKLDAAGHYDDFEVDRVVAVELKPDATQGELLKAFEPVVDRLMKRYKAA